MTNVLDEGCFEKDFIAALTITQNIVIYTLKNNYTIMKTGK
jgi:hypothetical protein